MQFYAKPYNPDARGFFFESYSEFEEKSAALKDSFGLPVEEFRIEAMDGTSNEMRLYDAANVTQGEIKGFIEFINTSDEDEWPTLFYLMDSCGMSLNDARLHVEDYNVVESTLMDAATKMFDEYYGYTIPEELRIYIDYERFAHDCEIGGDMDEFEFGGKTYTCTNANQ